MTTLNPSCSPTSANRRLMKKRTTTPAPVVGLVIGIFMVVAVQLYAGTAGSPTATPNTAAPIAHHHITPKMKISRSPGLTLEGGKTPTTLSATSRRKDENQLPVPRDCQVLITNQNVDFHYETLESALALYPLPPLHDQANICNHLSLKFTVKLSNGRNYPPYRKKSASWMEYATDKILPRDYEGLVTPQQSRRLVHIQLTPNMQWDDYNNDNHTTTAAAMAIGATKTGNAMTTTSTTTFDYIIDASCYCDGRYSNQKWLALSPKHHYCVFHTVCPSAPTSQSQWLNPMLPHSYFPAFLPAFYQQQQQLPLDSQTTHHHLCVIGQVSRRQYDLVEFFLNRTAYDNNDKPPVPLLFHNFGWGEVPHVFADPRRKNMFQIHVIPDFVPYQKALFETCDAILSLLTQSNQTQYFAGKTQLSGALVQASFYRKPLVVHQELMQRGYRPYLTHEGVETHTDDPETFVRAMQRLLQHLNAVRKEKKMPIFRQRME